MTIERVTAVTEVFQGGTRVTEALLSVSGPFSPADLDPSALSVQQITEDGKISARTVTGVRKQDDKTVVLALSPEDQHAAVYRSGDPWTGVRARILPARILVNGIENDATENRICDDFETGTFGDICYSLYVPRGYDPKKSYPLVQFIADASACGSDPRLSVQQGYGAVSFADPRQQEKHPCFVLCPQFDIPAIVDDDGHVDARLETAKRLLDHVIQTYSIDRNRIYTTGQSMGCMSSLVLNLRYPDLFAASFFVAGQWNENAFRGAGLEDRHFWFLSSQGDAKAFPGMNQILAVLEREGAEVARKVWDAGLDQEAYRKMAKDLTETGANMIYTPFRMETVADGWRRIGGEHHVDTWRYAYRIDAIHDWLFDQTR